jgi:hypothetical protein
MMNMYVMLMLMLWDVNACLTSRGVTDVVHELHSMAAHWRATARRQTSREGRAAAGGQS